MSGTRPKIAYVLTAITFGGAEKVSLNFLGGIRRTAFDVLPIILVRPWEPPTFFAREMKRLGYAYHTLPVALKERGADPLRVLRVATRLYALLKSEAFDLVHTHGYFADICTLPAARLLGIRSISTCHGYIAGDARLRIYNYLDRRSLRLASAVIAVSDGIADDLIRSGVRESRLSVIPNAVSISQGESAPRTRPHEKRRALGIADAELVIGYLGRLSAEKGLPFLIRAMKHLAGEFPVKLLIIGDGSERLALAKMVDSLGLGEKVLFTGFQPDPEALLSVVDIFALPSLTEGTPMALLEAMAARVPVVATRVGGVPRLVTDGVDGLLVPSGDSEALAHAMRTLIRDSDLRERLGAAGLETVRTRYSLGPWCRQIEAQYKSLLADHV